MADQTPLDPYAIGEGAQRIFRSVRDERDQLRDQVAELEEQLRELRAYADHADWREREVLALLDVTEDREMPGECRVIAKEIRAVYARQGGGDAGEARQGVSAPRRRDSGTRATESTPETAQATSDGQCTSRHTDGHAVARCQQPAGHEQHRTGPRTWYSGDGDELLDTLTPHGRRIHAAIDLLMCADEETNR